MLYITPLLLVYHITGGLYLTLIPASSNHKSDLQHTTLC